MTDEIPPIRQGVSNFLMDEGQTAATSCGVMVNASFVTADRRIVPSACGVRRDGESWRAITRSTALVALIDRAESARF
jgi:hypothetical protein